MRIFEVKHQKALDARPPGVQKVLAEHRLDVGMIWKILEKIFQDHVRCDGLGS